VRIGSLAGPLVSDDVLKRAYALAMTWCGAVLRRVQSVSEVKVKEMVRSSSPASPFGFRGQGVCKEWCGAVLRLVHLVAEGKF
jgi:hypothetical protein